MAQQSKPILPVGSIPGNTAMSVFSACGPSPASNVDALPDGETGMRGVWVTYLAATALDPHPHINVINRPKPVGSINDEWRTDKGSYDIVAPAYGNALREEINQIEVSIPADELLIQWDFCMEVVAADLNDFTGQPPLAFRLEGPPVERWTAAL